VSDDVLSFSCGHPANDASAAVPPELRPGYLGGVGGDDAAIRFHLSVEEGRVVGCREVRGFQAATLAAEDPRAAMPPRVSLAGLDAGAQSWIEAWSEDCDRVRRTVSIRRLLDDRELTAVVTLASFGSGVEISLSIESLTAGPAGTIPVLQRSGVHPRAILVAALGPDGRSAHERESDAERENASQSKSENAGKREEDEGEGEGEGDDDSSWLIQI
jgi:hypothetical protein